MNLIKSEEGTFRLNNICYLKRWTTNGLGIQVDKLALEFDNINGVCFYIDNVEILARDYEGIIAECQELQTRFLQEVETRLFSWMGAGYIVKGKR